MKVNYCVADDWQGIYVNGLLKEEEHEISIMEFLNIIVEDWESDDKLEVCKFYIDQDWVEDYGNFPNSFTDIPDEVIAFDEKISF
ncbi:MAG: hypothetical protein RR347_09465 [Anaerovoracaceae bacterium]